jgi:hypothetical protein
MAVLALDKTVEAARGRDKAGREAGLHLLLPGQAVGLPSLPLGGSGEGGGKGGIFILPFCAYQADK